MKHPPRVTELLLSLRAGDRRALDELMPLIHQELRRIASAKLRLERSGHTLSTTALVNEAYLQLVQAESVRAESRAQFLALAATAMRHILVSHARRRNRRKRGGGAAHVPLSEAAEVPIGEPERILGLDSALEKLAALNSRHARIVECRFFGGMSIEETATALDVSPATIKRDWVVLRGWLERELGGAA